LEVNRENGPNEPVARLHRVSDPRGCNACSVRYVGPVIGNGQISLFLDENGVMHDHETLPARLAPRIYWAGRRNRIGDSRPMAPFGFITESPGWSWMESTRWEQTLDVRGGMVVTTHDRGNARESTTTCVLLDRNLVAIHKRVEALRGSPSTTFRFRLCPPNSSGLPDGFQITGHGSDATGCWIDYVLRGVVEYRGRIALWMDRACTASAIVGDSEAELRLSMPVARDDEFTAYLQLVDDVGDDPLYRAAGWEASRFLKHPRLEPAIEHLKSAPIHREDPVEAVASCRQWTSDVNWAGIEAHQRKQWADWWSTCQLELPDAPDVQAIWETGFYMLRTQLTRWSVPVAIHGGCFDGRYFPDEFAALKLLLVSGHHELVRRILDHKLSCLPLGFNMTDGVGARGAEVASLEGGGLTLGVNHTSLYEVYAVSFAPQYAWTWLKYSGMRDEDLRTYYPLFWSAAEFFRRWMVYRGPDGKLFTGACTDFDETNAGVVNGVGTTGAAIRSTHLAAEAASRLKCDETLISLWREVAQGLSVAIPTTSRQTISAYAGDEGVTMVAMRLVNTPFMMAPLTPRDPRVKRTIHTWLTECKIPQEGWAVCKAKLEPGGAPKGGDIQHPDVGAWTWLPAEVVGVLAMLSDGATAASVVDELIRCALNFGSLYECKVLADGFISLPVFPTSSTELSASISLMLLTPHDAADGQATHLAILPAVPESWRNLKYTLWAPNRTSVSVEVRDGRLTRLELQSPLVQRWTVSIPSRFEAKRVLGAPTRRENEVDWFDIEVTQR
jgi:hypothetical protein